MTKKEVILLLKELSKKKGDSIRKSEFPNLYSVKKHFNSWSEALEAAGLKSRKKNNYSKLSNQELLIEFRNEFIRTNSKSMRDYRKKRDKTKPSIEYIKKKLELKENKILEMCNLQICKIAKHNNDTLINELIYLNKSLKVAITCEVFEKNNRLGIHPNTLIRRFGSWNNALLKAEIKTSHEITHVLESDEELIKLYIDFSKKVGRVNGATITELNDSVEIYHSGIFIMRFGSMHQLRLKSGFDSIEGRFIYKREEIIFLLIKEYKKKGSKLTNKEIEKNKYLPSVNTVCRYFNTTKMSDVWKEIL